MKKLKRILAALQHTRWVPSGTPERRVVLDMREPYRVRALRQILLHFNLAGYEVVIPWRKQTRYLGVAESLAWHPGTRFSVGVPKTKIFLSDDRARLDTSAAEHRILLDDRYWPGMELGHSELAFPFTMHPQIYGQYKDHEKLEAYRDRPRSVDVLFVGNAGPGYDNDLITGLCGKLSRHHAIQTLSGQPEVTSIEDQAGLERIFADDPPSRICLLDTEKVRVDQQRWLDLLSRAAFFLALPGVRFPLSHNLVESLAIGTVPITNYADWLFPNLQSCKEALTFSDEGGLKSAVAGALATNPDERARLKAAAIGYYGTHLDSHAFVERLLATATPEATLRFPEGDDAWVVKTAETFRKPNVPTHTQVRIEP